VVLKVLGAARVTILRTFLIEYGALGLVTAVIAGALGTLTVRCVGEKRLSAGDAVTLRPEPKRIYRFDENGNSIFA
jgi:predicted lysophospholipase L1 biosynthesis ABC-type transport system permease subunit